MCPTFTLTYKQYIITPPDQLGSIASFPCWVLDWEWDTNNWDNETGTSLGKSSLLTSKKTDSE